MQWIQQTFSVTWQNLKSLPSRLGNTVVTLIGVAGVVGVFVAVLSISSGFQKTMESGAGENNILILRTGSSSEMDSGFSNDQVNMIKDTEGIAESQAGKLVSAELFVVVDLPKKSTNTSANVPFRGVEPIASQIRKDFTITEGRMFTEGKMEIIAGRGAQAQFAGIEVGSELKFGQNTWTVVGTFTANGGVAESELWTDVRVLQPAYRRGNSFNAVYAQLQDVEAFTAFKDSLTTNPYLTVDVRKEQAYYAEQSQVTAKFISGLGTAIMILMAIGACFGAINTMYTAVSERAREIATLRALGFRSSTVVISVLVESILLSTIGGILGALIAYVLFNGFTVSTLGASFSQVVFAFAVTPDLLVSGVVIAVLIGLLGGLLPAIRAARLPVTTALRQL